MPTTSPGALATPSPSSTPATTDVIGCVYLYPSASEEWDVTVQSWVRADRSSLDGPLADAVARWLATDWPWERVNRCGR
jgi:hypothetical protein